MSKKLAEGLDALVLDVKFGSGAFLPDPARSRLLAETMVGIGRSRGLRTVALLTSMDAPLGAEVGNASEIRESLEVLRGGGPDDLVEITLALGVEMLLAAGVESDAGRARSRLEATRVDGTALEVFSRVVAAQGGDARVVEDPSLLPTARRHEDLPAHEDGYLTHCDSRRIGIAAMRLGAGRERKEDTIDPAVGITILAKPGDEVRRGQPLARLGYRHTARLAEALRVLDGAFEIGNEPPARAPLVAERIGD
jgi:thymidine phosphorylase